MTSPAFSATRFGYLLVHDTPRCGWIGGCLVVTELGHPVEFHCTEPVLPSRAEEILYGETLRDHVVGERIAPALLARLEASLDLLLVTENSASAAGGRAGFRTAVLVGPMPQYDNLESERLANQLSQAIDLAEPFERVREAIQEAQRMCHEAGTHDDDLAA